MVHETLTGTLGIIEAKNVTAPALRNAVTSPGGTTEAALREFEKMDFHGVIAKSLKAAFERARELAT